MSTEGLIRIAIGLACGGGGYMVGRFERTTQAGKPATRRWGDLGRIALGIVIVALALYTQISVSRTNACYQDYFTQVSANLSARAVDTDSTSDAQVRLLDATLSPDRSDDVPAIRDYIAKLQQQKATRAAAPIPQPPECR